MTNPNFGAIAEGYYLKARKVTKREDLAAAVKEMMESKEGDDISGLKLDKKPAVKARKGDIDSFRRRGVYTTRRREA